MGTQPETDALLGAIRAQSPATGLYALGRFAFGTDCAIVANGVGFRGIGDNVRLVDGIGQSIRGRFEVHKDHALTGLGLEIICADRRNVEVSWRCQLAGVIYRAGLVLKMLDQAQAHLADRESNGQKTLRHQLVKATFAECYSLTETLRLEIPYLLSGDSRPDLSLQHDSLSKAGDRASKLMGGHGFLQGQGNSLEMLSYCVFNQLTRATRLIARRSAA